MSGGAVVIIGYFDGVHRGHRAVLVAGARLAEERGLAVRLLTFDPHPSVTLGRVPPPTLTTLERKRELLLRACPAAELVVRSFDRAFAALAPEAFAERVLVHELGARVVMVGDDFRFGRGRTGGMAELVALGERLGFATIGAPLVGDDEGPWSSTRIRMHVQRGEVEAAARLLGRPHLVSGVVSHGQRRGRTLGFPTCNLASVPEALPANGVYAVLVDRVDSGEARALGRGVCNLGMRPTIGDLDNPLLEAHVFDLDQELYGAHLRVHLVARLRGERRFAGLDELRRQIAQDCEDALASLAEAQPDPAARGAWS